MQLLCRVRRSTGPLRVGIRRLGRAWGRNCPRWGSANRFTRRALRGRGRSCLRAGELGAFFQPRLVILRRIYDQCAFHSVMAKPAQLGANHFIGSCLNRREPDWNERTRNGIARDAHVRHEEIVDHIFRGKLCNHRPIHRHMEFAGRYDVVFASRIIWIDAERV